MEPEYTPEQYREAARRAFEAGNIAAAEELAQAGIAAQGAASTGGQAGELEFDAVRSMLGSAEDIGRSVGREALQLGGGIMDIIQAPSRAADFALARGSRAVADVFGVDVPEWTQRPYKARQQLLGGRGMMESGPITGPAMRYETQTLPGDIAATSVEMAPGILIGPGGLGTRAAYNVIAPALGQIGGERAAEALNFGETGQLVGGILGSITAPTALASKTRLLSPASGVASGARGARADLLERAMLDAPDGVGLSAGQRVGDQALRTVEGTLTASDDQLRAFTNAVVRQQGGTWRGSLPETIRGLSDDIGQMFDDVAAAMPPVNPYSTVSPTGSTIVDRLRQVSDRYGRSVGSGERVSIVDDVANWMEQSLRSGRTIDPEEALRWRSELSEITATSANRATRTAAGAALRETDDLLDATLRSTGNPDLSAMLTDARRRWRDFLAFRHAASRAGEAPLEGAISPQALAQALRRQNDVGYALGDRGAFGDISRAGEQILRPAAAVPAGGVREAPTLQAQQTAETAATVLSGIGPGAAAAGAVGARLLPKARGAFVNDPLMQQYYRLGYLPAPRTLPFSTRALTFGPLAVQGAGD